MSTTLLLLCLAATAARAGEWIWTGEGEPNPKNRFTYFRAAADLEAVPRDGTLLLAADSNARVWINGHVARRKVTRYHEDRITADVIQAGPYLRPGRNVVVVLHHNWGPIVTFQRSANRHAGLYVESPWLRSGPSWRWTTAPEFLPHDRQVVGIIQHARIRYAQIVDGRKTPVSIHDPAFDDRSWKSAAVVANGPWPAAPPPVETEAMREYPAPVQGLVNAGVVDRPAPTPEPFSMAAGIRAGKYSPRPEPRAQAINLVNGGAAAIDGEAGEWRYLTFDFHRPVHGYPYLELESSLDGAAVDFGYAEIAWSQYDGSRHVETTGWLNPEGVVGPGYADRYIARAGSQYVELPDERTARWLTVQIHFPARGRVAIRRAGFVKSQYPVRLAGSFDCGDERIRQIVSLGLIHAEVTMNDVYVDTPGREDGQWIEDARVRALIADRWSGEWRLRRILLRHYAESQGKDGGFHAFPPANFPAYPVNYDWSVQWPAMLYDDYYWTGGTELVVRYWDTLERYWGNVLARVDEEGLFRTNRVFADIRVGARLTAPHQSSGIVTPFVIDRLRWSAEMADAAGRKRHAERWRAAAEKMTEAFRRHHLLPAADGRPALAADRLDTRNLSLERGVSQAGQAMAVLAGMFTRAGARAALDYAFPDPDGAPPPGVTRWNNPTFAYRALRSLSDSGYARRAVAHLVERYAPYLPGHPRNRTPLELQGPYGGPLPEYWIGREDLRLDDGQPNTAQPRDDTGSHGWGAVPLLWLHDTLLGVRIVEPGGGKLRIAPQDGGLPYVAGHTMTPKGPVWVNWEPDRWRLEVRLPPQTSAEVLLPGQYDGKNVSCEGCGPAAQTAPGTYRVGPGQYLFTAR